MIRRQSNLGFSLTVDEDRKEAQDYDEMRKKLMEALKRSFRPEFINRLDSVVVFRALNKADIREIVQLELDKVNQRLEENRIRLRATHEALEYLAEEGYNPEMGARPLRRVIQHQIEDCLSDALLAKEFDDGDNILIDIEEKQEDGTKKTTIVLLHDPLGDQEEQPDLAALEL
jgi:ATP-dependent Clp protease ATP-binding subunit ClpC